MAAATDFCRMGAAIVRASCGPFNTNVTEECSFKNSWPTITSAHKFFITLNVEPGYVRSKNSRVAAVLPFVRTEASDDAMPIGTGGPFTGNFIESQTLESIKFSEAPESTRICTETSLSFPLTTADSRQEGHWQGTFVRCLGAPAPRRWQET